jgi:hypothetical protein
MKVTLTDLQKVERIGNNRQAALELNLSTEEKLELYRLCYISLIEMFLEAEDDC